MPAKRRRLYSPRKSLRNIEKLENAHKKEQESLTNEVNPGAKESIKAPKQEYEIESIDDHRLNQDQNKVEFFVKWKGYGAQDRTWEPFEMFAYDAPDMAQEYLVKTMGHNGSEARNKQDENKEHNKNEEMKQEEGANSKNSKI